MYDNDETPTADGVQAWLNFIGFWKEKSVQMMDKYLSDFSLVWKGIPDVAPPQSYQEEAVALRREQEEKDSHVNAAGCAMHMDTSGNLTIQQTGVRFIVVAANQVEEFMTALNSITPSPSQPIINLGQGDRVQIPAHQASAPTTPGQKQLMQQNELAAQQFKARRR